METLFSEEKESLLKLVIAEHINQIKCSTGF